MNGTRFIIGSPPPTSPHGLPPRSASSRARAYTGHTALCTPSSTTTDDVAAGRDGAARPRESPDGGGTEQSGRSGSGVNGRAAGGGGGGLLEKDGVGLTLCLLYKLCLWGG